METQVETDKVKNMNEMNEHYMAILRSLETPEVRDAILYGLIMRVREKHLAQLSGKVLPFINETKLQDILSEIEAISLPEKVSW